MTETNLLDQPSAIKRSRRARRTTSFDTVVVGVIGGLAALIALTLLVGDRVGVTLERVAPLERAHSTSLITIEFSEAMQRDTVTDRLRIEPEISGTFTWSGTVVNFRPERAMQPGGEYTVILEAGAVSETGREVLSEYRYTFAVMRPQIAYLYPSDATPMNIWIADPADASSARQLTFSEAGIYDFAPSPDGTRIAFSENNLDTGTTDIKIIDLETGALTQITNCQDASCTNPTWRPDGNTIAYERIEYNSDMQGMASSPPRVWLIDLLTTPATTRPLFSDLQVLGYDPQWSADGQRIALYDRSTAAILVYNFTDDSLTAVPTQVGEAGALSPDGTRLIYPELTITEGQTAREFLQIVDLEGEAQRTLSTLEQPFNDKRAEWRPDGAYIAVAREDLFTPNRPQIHLVNPDDPDDARQLTDDPRYSNFAFWWDPTGTQLVIQRFPQLDEAMQPNALGRPEIWTLDTETGDLVQVAVNGFLPRWVP